MRRTQEFCSDECRKARASWKERRGATLVDPLIEDDFIELRKLQDSIRQEIAAETRINPQENSQ